MDKIERIRAFSAVIENGSFTAAAQRASLKPQLISKYVKALEDELQVRLLNRTTRSVRPTETGRAFYEKARQLLDDFDELYGSVRTEHSAPRGHLRITAPISFGELFIVPVVAEFLRAYPETSVDLHLSDRHVGMVDEGFDVAIRIGALESSGLIAKRLADEPIRLCASPAYLESAGVPKDLDALASHDCVIDANFREPDIWRFVVEGRKTSVRVRGRFRVNSAIAVRQLVLSGAGLALCPSYVVKDDLARGALVSLMEGAIAHHYGIYAVYAESRHLSGKIRAFVDFTSASLVS